MLTSLDYLFIALGSLVGTALVCLVAAAVAGPAVMGTRRRNRMDGASEPADAGGPPAVERARQHARTFTRLAWVWLVVGLPVGFYGVSTAYVQWALWQRNMGPDGEPVGSALTFFIVDHVPPDQVHFVTPIAVGAGFLVVYAIGERTWPRPSGASRQAVLAPRSVRALAGQTLPAWSVALGVVMVAALFAAAITGDRSDSTFIVTHRGGGGFGTWPGAALGVPLLTTMAVVAVLTVLVLRATTRRPAVAGTTEADDLALRQASARRVLAVVQLVTGLALASVLERMGAGLKAAGAPDWEWIDHVRHEIPANSAQVALGTMTTVVAVVVLVASIAVTVWAVVQATRAERAVSRADLVCEPTTSA
ncbi:MAG: hypothetical protein FWF21_10000 [Micrococcales bacterium]|nr:hypothetical protein [Micrococcales bacterium]